MDAREGSGKADRLSTVLYNLTEAINIGASLLESFMPETADAILAEINAPKRPLAEMDKWGLYPSGNKVTDSPKTLFERKDLAAVMAEVEKIEAKQKAALAASSNASGATSSQTADGKAADGKSVAAGAAAASATTDVMSASAEGAAADDGMPEGLDENGDAFPDTKILIRRRSRRSSMMISTSFSSASARSFMRKRCRSRRSFLSLRFRWALRREPFFPASRSSISRRTSSASMS